MSHSIQTRTLYSNNANKTETETDEVSVAGYGSWVFESAFAFVFPLGFQN